MRHTVVMLLAILLAPFPVGCLGQSDPVVDAAASSGADAPPPQPSPTPAPAAEPSPTPEEPEPSTTQASTELADEPAPDEPEPVAWTLARRERLGWLVGVGLGSSGPGNVGRGHADAEHCPDAKIVVPEGAGRLTVHVFDANETGGGLYDVQVTTPDGTVVHNDAFLGALPGGEAPPPLDFADPGAGEWALHVEPSGPVVGRVYLLHVEVVGTSVVVPAELAGGAAC